MYKWNNILQTSIMDMLHIIFHSERHEFCKKLLEQTDLIPRVSKLLLEDLKREQNGFVLLSSLFSFHLEHFFISFFL